MISEPEPCQTSKMESFAKTVNDWKLLIIFAKPSVLDVRQGFEFTSGFDPKWFEKVVRLILLWQYRDNLDLNEIYRMCKLQRNWRIKF